MKVLTFKAYLVGTKSLMALGVTGLSETGDSAMTVGAGGSLGGGGGVDSACFGAGGSLEGGLGGSLGAEGGLDSVVEIIFSSVDDTMFDSTIGGVGLCGSAGVAVAAATGDAVFGVGALVAVCLPNKDRRLFN